MEQNSRLPVRLVTSVLLAWFLYRILRDFIEPLAWAVLLVYASWPIYAWLRLRLGGRGGWSAALMVLALGVAVLAPCLWLSAILQREIGEYLRHLPGWLEAKPELPAWLAEIPFVGDELGEIYAQFEDLQSLARRYLLPRLTALSGGALSVLEGAGFFAAKSLMTWILMFFAYRDGAAWAQQVGRGLVLAFGQGADCYLRTAERTTRAVFYGIVMTAIVQGGVAGLGYWAVGLPAPALLTLLTMGAALIPFGAVVVWLLSSLWLLAHGALWPGISLLLWGALVVSWVDNLVRPIVISRSTRIPFVLVILGVLGGLTSFGAIGLFVGPVILAIALAIWQRWLDPADAPAA